MVTKSLIVHLLVASSTPYISPLLFAPWTSGSVADERFRHRYNCNHIFKNQCCLSNVKVIFLCTVIDDEVYTEIYNQFY